MLATQKQVRSIVKSLADMKGDLYKRAWLDKTTKDKNQRLMALRFWKADEADKVARKLRQQLKAQGYTNEVLRYSVPASYETQSNGGEYIRLRVLFE